jgi:hypothetical protein
MCRYINAFVSCPTHSLWYKKKSFVTQKASQNIPPQTRLFHRCKLQWRASIKIVSGECSGPASSAPPDQYN